MPQLLREAGLELDASFSYVVADIGKADFGLPPSSPSFDFFPGQAP
jgi:hypothetical protein